MAIVPVDFAYASALEAIDEDAYGPGVYEWGLGFKHVTVMTCDGVKGFVGYILSRHSVIIEKLAVRRDLRRQGYGTEMLKWVIQRARRNSVANIRTRLMETNRDGAEFLWSRGFQSHSEGRIIVFDREVIV